MLHELKYKDHREIGIELGRFLAADLTGTPRFQGIDYIVPVPLHRNKQKKRGYNQSECIAQGMSEIMQVPVDTDNLQRIIENPTQTRKSVFERWENVKGIFELKDKEAFVGKHILLVDDVLTTGSTVEACAGAVLAAEDARVSVVTLAVA